MTASSRSHAARSTSAGHGCCGTACCVERIQVTNYRLDRVEVPISLYFDADFADVFEVRGTRRARRGERLPDESGDGYLMRYHGLDDRERRAQMRWSRRPDRGGQNRVMWMLSLEPMATASVDVSVVYDIDGRPPPAADRVVRPRAGHEERGTDVRRTPSAVSSRARAPFSTGGSSGRPPTCRS